MISRINETILGSGFWIKIQSGFIHRVSSIRPAPEARYVNSIGIPFLSPCRGGIYDARHCGFDKSNPYRPAPEARYVNQSFLWGTHYSV